MAKKPKKLLDQVHDAVRRKQYAYRSELSYGDWDWRLTLFQYNTHDKDQGANKVQEFLTYITTERIVSPSTQKQARSILIFLYRDVLHKEIDLPTLLITAKHSTHLPTVLTPTKLYNGLQC